MSYKAVIFDMDGTIISSENLWEQATKHLLTKVCNLSDQEYTDIIPFFKGASLYTTCEYMHKTFKTKESVEELMQLKEDFYTNGLSKEITFIEGFEQFHKNLSEHGLKSAIATNANLSSLDTTMKHIPLDNFFNQHIYSIDHVGKKPKPEPDVFLHAADMLNTDPSLCIVIEDSTHGIAAAKAANMFCIGINTGKNKQALKQADVIIDHYNEINLTDLL